MESNSNNEVEVKVLDEENEPLSKAVTREMDTAATGAADVAVVDGDSNALMEAENSSSQDPEEECDDCDADPSVSRDVFVMGGCYHKQAGGRSGGFRMVSNMTLQATAKVVSINGWSYQCIAQRNTGEEHQINLHRHDFLSSSAFKRALSFHSDLEFYGSNYDTTQIQGLLADQNPPVVEGTNRNGIHLIDRKMVYVEGDSVIDKNGAFPGLVYTGETNNSSRVSGLMQQANISKKALKVIAENLNKFNHPSVTYLVLGFIGYCFVKGAITDKVDHHNPFLLCQGEPGSGKSLTISKVIMPIFDSQQPFVNIGSVSEYALALNSGNSNMTPVCYDEYKHAILVRSQERMIDRFLLATYAQTGIQRGRPNKAIDNLPMIAPVILAGEVTVDSSSLNHRKIEVFFSYAKRQGTSDSFQQLIRQPLGAFGKGLLLHVLKLGASRLGDEYDKQERKVDSGIDDRFRDNAALMRTGLWLITDYFKSQGISIDDYAEGFDTIDAVVMDAVNRAKITNVEKTIADFCTMADMGKLINLEDYQVKGNHLRLKIANVYIKYESWSNRNATSEFIGKRSFLQQLAGKKYYTGKRAMRIGGVSCNAISIDLSSFPEGMDISWPDHQRISLVKATV